MNKFKDFEKPKIIKYELVVFRNHFYRLYTYNGTEYEVFDTKSKARIKIQLDLLGIDHFDRIQKHCSSLNGDIHTYFSLLKYEFLVF